MLFWALVALNLPDRKPKAAEECPLLVAVCLFAGVSLKIQVMGNGGAQLDKHEDLGMARPRKVMAPSRMDEKTAEEVQRSLGPNQQPGADLSADLVAQVCLQRRVER